MKFSNIAMLVVLFLCSCSGKGKVGQIETMDLRNKLALLDHFGLERKTDLDLFELKVSSEEKLKRYFDFPFCDQLKYSVDYEVLDGLSVPVVVQSCFNDCSTALMTRRGGSCFALLTYQGRVLIESEPCDMDAIGDKIVSFYKKQDTSSKLKKVNVSILWDKGVGEKYFRQFLNQIIGGYFKYVALQSEKYFHKSIGELNISELKILGELFPFNLYVNFDRIKMSEVNLESLIVPINFAPPIERQSNFE